MLSFKQYISENTKPVIGINIRNDNKVNRPYADLVVDGEKKYETRDKPTLNHLIGQEVGVVKTGAKGKTKAKAIGSCILGEPEKVGYDEFRRRESEHLVPQDSDYDCKKDGHKWMYPINKPQRWDKEQNVEMSGNIFVHRKIYHEED